MVKIIILLSRKAVDIIKNPKKLVKVFKHPEIILQFYRNIRDAKVLNKGERAIIYNWEKARKGKESAWNWGQLAQINRYEWVLPLVKKGKLLDMGCAAGSGTYYLSLHGVTDVVGLDISEDALGWARSHYKSKNLKFIAADALNLPFQDKSFDTVISFDLLEHIPKKQQLKCISEIARVIKPSGIVVIGTPNVKADEKAITGAGNPFHEHELNKEELESLMGNFFKEVRMRGEDTVVDGQRLKEKWLEYLNENEIEINNLQIFDNDLDKVRGLIAVCKK